MKKSWKLLLTAFSFAFVMFLAMGTTSKAAGWDAGLKQTAAGQKSISISWNPYIQEGVAIDHYETEYRMDGTNFAPTSTWNHVSGTEETIPSLAAGKVYWVRVKAVAEGADYKDVVVAVSNPLQVATLPTVGRVEGLMQSAATANSATFTWTPVSGATGYDIYLSQSLWHYTKVGSTSGTSYTVTSLPTGYAGEYFVMAKKTTFNGFEATGDMKYDGYFKRIDVKSLPAKVQSIAVSAFYSNSCSFKWSVVNNADGYQLQTKNAKGKVVSTTSYIGTSGSVSPFKKGQFYSTRVRAYVKVGNGYAYGPWSNYSYNALNKSIKWIRSANRKKITLKWKKIAGACGYKVYISTKSGKGYKKVKTCGKNSKGCTITKCGKKKLSKKKTYYVRVEYLKKVGKKKVVSGIAGFGTVRS